MHAGIPGFLANIPHILAFLRQSTKRFESAFLQFGEMSPLKISGRESFSGRVVVCFVDGHQRVPKS